MVIFRAAMANPVFAQITAEPSAMFPSDNGEQLIVNQDELLQRYQARSAARRATPTPLARRSWVPPPAAAAAW